MSTKPKNTEGFEKALVRPWGHEIAWPITHVMTQPTPRDQDSHQPHHSVNSIADTLTTKSNPFLVIESVYEQGGDELVYDVQRHITKWTSEGYFEIMVNPAAKPPHDIEFRITEGGLAHVIEAMSIETQRWGQLAEDLKAI